MTPQAPTRSHGPRHAAPGPGAPRPGAPRPGAPRPGAPRPGAPRPGAPRPGARGAAGGSATLLSATSGVVGLLSYAVTLAMAHLLAPGEYTTFAAAAALVGTAGVASAALVPFPLAHVVRAHPARSPERRDAVSFAVGVSVVVGVVAAGLLGAITAGVAPAATALAATISVAALFLIAPVWGFLQGEERFGRYAVLTVAEVAVRVAVSVLAVLAGLGAAGAVGAFAAGAVVVLAGVSLAPGSPLREVSARAVARTLRAPARWAETGGVAATQAVLSGLAVADAVAVAALLTDPADAAAAGGYQAVATLAKAPVFVAVGTALVAFPALRVSRGAERTRRLTGSLVSFVRLVVPAAAVVATVPAGIAGLVLPDAYRPALGLLGWLALAGAGLGTTTVLATLMLAVGARRALALTLTAAAGALVVGITVGLLSGAASGSGSTVAGAVGASAVAGLAPGLAGGAVLGALVALAAGAAGRPRVLGHRPAATAAHAGLAVLYALAVLGVLSLARGSAALWVAAVVVLGVLVVGGPVLLARFALPAEGPDAHGGAPDPRGLRVLHLGFEDPAMPGSGGGSLRTREIDRRLAAAGHRVTVLTTRHPGARDRVEHEGAGWVRWVHPGVGHGTNRLTRLLGYLVAAPLAARHAEAEGYDLVVEDFCAPISSMAVPLWTRLPVVGVVQWLNATEKARQYHLPVHLVERAGVRTHRHLIAMSHGVAARLHAMNPDAHVEVIGNGVDPLFGVARDAGGTAAAPPGADVVYVGRLETAQKGLDLLVDAWAQVVRVGLPTADGPGPTLVIAGTGPDEGALRARVEALGVGDRVRFAGWVGGEDKVRLVASARLAVVPSRFETFGIVAAEALAAGTAVVASDIDCLREVVPAEAGVLVPLTGDHRRDVIALAAALTGSYSDDALVARAAAHGPDLARAHDWDALAATQDRALRAAAGRGTR